MARCQLLLHVWRFGMHFSCNMHAACKMMSLGIPVLFCIAVLSLYWGAHSHHNVLKMQRKRMPIKAVLLYFDVSFCFCKDASMVHIMHLKGVNRTYTVFYVSLSWACVDQCSLPGTVWMSPYWLCLLQRYCCADPSCWYIFVLCFKLFQNVTSPLSNLQLSPVTVTTSENLVTVYAVPWTYVLLTAIKNTKLTFLPIAYMFQQGGCSFSMLEHSWLQVTS